MNMEKGLALMLAARRGDHPFFAERHYMRRPSIEEGKMSEPVVGVWDALGMLVRAFNDGTDRSIRLRYAVRNKHAFSVLQVHVPGSWRKSEYDYPISEDVVTQLRQSGYVDIGTFWGMPYNLVLRLNKYGEEALYDHLAELAEAA